MVASGTGNTVWVEGRMDSTKRQQILEANVPVSKETEAGQERVWIIQQDND